METIKIVKARNHHNRYHAFTIPKEIPVKTGAKYTVKVDGEGRIIYDPVDKPGIVDGINGV